jgi:hypothetical protein
MKKLGIDPNALSDDAKGSSGTSGASDTPQTVSSPLGATFAE